MTKENLIKNLKHYREVGNKKAEAQLLKKYPELEAELLKEPIVEREVKKGKK